MTPEHKPDFRPFNQRYPKTEDMCWAIADRTCRDINRVAPSMHELTPYQAQGMLERVVAILQGRI